MVGFGGCEGEGGEAFGYRDIGRDFSQSSGFGEGLSSNDDGFRDLLVAYTVNESGVLLERSWRKGAALDSDRVVLLIAAGLLCCPV
jgi:hypothetical protein